MPDAFFPVYFAAATTQVRPRDMSILDGHAAWLRGDGKRVLLIEGHTDEPGDSAFSRAVGSKRAQSDLSGPQPSCELLARRAAVNSLS